MSQPKKRAVSKTETLYTPKQAREVFKTNPSRQAISKWIVNGVKNRRTGVLVRLRTIQEGGRLLIPESAIDEFLSRLNEGKSD